MDTNRDELYSNLIARCAIHDQKALEALYKHVAPYLNKVAFSILRSEDLSNDVLQEAFIQIWKNAGEYRVDKSKPITWMTSIVRYRALDRLAKEKRHYESINHEEDPDEMHSDELISEEKESNDRPDIAAMQLQDSNILLECMETLNDRAKESITLAYLQGYSRQELAEKFNSSVNTVKSWLKRGAERLKNCIESKAEVNHE